MLRRFHIYVGVIILSWESADINALTPQRTRDTQHYLDMNQRHRFLRQHEQVAPPVANYVLCPLNASSYGPLLDNAQVCTQPLHIANRNLISRSRQQRYRAADNTFYHLRSYASESLSGNTRIEEHVTDSPVSLGAKQTGTDVTSIPACQVRFCVRDIAKLRHQPSHPASQGLWKCNVIICLMSQLENGLALYLRVYNTVIPLLRKMIRSGIAFVSRNVISRRFL